MMSGKDEEDLERGLRDKQRGSQGDDIGLLTGLPSPGTPTLQCVELQQINKPAVKQTGEGDVKKEKEEGRGNVSNSKEESWSRQTEGKDTDLELRQIKPVKQTREEGDDRKKEKEEACEDVSSSTEESRSRQTQEKDADLAFRAPCVFVSRILSAALYLFDVVTTLLVVKEYYEMDYFISPNIHDHSRHNQFGGLALPGVFLAVLIIILLAHVANAIAFKLILPTKEQPIMSAYFLPLIQLRRLLSDLWTTGTCHRLMISESNEAEALYAIMACAVETGPQLILQISILESTYLRTDLKRSSILFWSIAAGFLSGAFNGGRAVMYISNQKSKIRSYACGILGGLYSIAELLSRCSNIIIFVLIKENTSATPHYLVVYMTLAGVCPMVMIFLRARPKMRESLAARKVYHYGVRVCYAIVFGYVSSSVGPLYTIVSDARARKQLKQLRFLVWLLGMAFMHLIIDGIGWTLITTFYRESSANTFYSNRFDNYGKRCSDWGRVPCVSFRVGIYTGIVVSSVSIVSYSWLLSEDQHCLDDT